MKGPTLPAALEFVIRHRRQCGFKLFGADAPKVSVVGRGIRTGHGCAGAPLVGVPAEGLHAITVPLKDRRC